MHRRGFLTAVGASSVAVAGCLDGEGDTDDDAGDHDAGDDPDDATLFTVSVTDVESPEGTYLDFEVAVDDAAVTADDPAALELTLTNVWDDPFTVASDPPWPFGVVAGAATRESGPGLVAWPEGYDPFAHEAADVDTDREDGWHAAVLEPGESVSTTHLVRAAPPRLEAGDYRVRSTVRVEPEGVQESFRPTAFELSVERDGEPPEGPDPVLEEPRVDEPPHEIGEPNRPEEPGPPSDVDDDEEYLGEHMAEEPTLPFERLGSVGPRVSHLRDHRADREYAVRVLGTEAERDVGLAVEGADPDDRERLAEIDFEEQVVVVVESGWGSGSIQHRWARVEEADDGLHLHGYYTDPYVQTDDYTTRSSVLVVDRPESLDLARASLTTHRYTRVHFNSTEGVVEPGE